MANLIEKIALGELSIQGNIDLEITNPWTGRAYYKFEDHNLVLKGLYEYLKTLCIAALCSYDGHYGYRPLTAMGMSGTEGSPVKNHTGFCLRTSDYNPVGNGACGPSTSNAWTALKSPVDRVVLTDGYASEQYDHCDLIGTVVAEANLTTSVPSGGTLGTFSYAKSYENMRQLYRRWDWSSANGNGSLSRIHLCSGEPCFPIFDRSGSCSSVLPLPEGALSFLTQDKFIGSAGNRLFFRGTLSSSNVTFYVLEVEPGSGRVNAQTVTIAPNSFGNNYPHTNKIKLVEGNGVIYIVAGTTSVSYAQVYTYDPTENRIQGVEVKLYSNTEKLFFAYQSDPGNLRLGTWHGTTGYSLQNIALDTRVVTKIGALSAMEEFHKGYSILNGSELTCYDSFCVERVNVQTGATTRRVTSRFFENYVGGSYPFRANGMHCVAFIYTSASLPYVQIECIPEADASVLTMTERQLPDTVVKNDMPMYVGYTLNFE